MDKLSPIERLQEVIDFAHDNEITDSIAVSLDELEAWQRIMKMFCWGTGIGDTVVISRKKGISIAMVMRADEQPCAGFEGLYGGPVAAAEAVSDTLEDLALGVKALVEEVERLANA